MWRCTCFDVFQGNCIIFSLFFGVSLHSRFAFPNSASTITRVVQILNVLIEFLSSIAAREEKKGLRNGMRQLIRKARSQTLFRENLSLAFNLHFMSLHEKKLFRKMSHEVLALGPTHNGPSATCRNCNSSETLPAPRSDHDLTQQTVSRFFQRPGAISDPARLEKA